MKITHPTARNGAPAVDEDEPQILATIEADTQEMEGTMRSARIVNALALCAAAPLLAACAEPSVNLKTCQPLADDSLQHRLLEVVRPYVEHVYPSHTITLEDVINMGVPEFYDCGATYQVLFTTVQPNGDLSVGGESEYQIDKDSMDVSGVWHFGM